MILNNAISALKTVIHDIGCESCDLKYVPLQDHHTCQFCHGKCMGIEFGGKQACICSSSVPLFSARVKLSDLFDAPLKSDKTRVAAAGALTVVSGFLMLNRKISPCSPCDFDNCRLDLIKRCSGLQVCVLGSNIVGLNQVESVEDADLVIVTGDSIVYMDTLIKIDSLTEVGKNILFVGPEWSGVSTLLNLDHWCPYGQ